MAAAIINVAAGSLKAGDKILEIGLEARSATIKVIDRTTPGHTMIGVYTAGNSTSPKKLRYYKFSNDNEVSILKPQIYPNG